LINFFEEIGAGIGVSFVRKKMEEELRLKKEEIEKWNRELKKRVEEGIRKQ